MGTASEKAAESPAGDVTASNGQYIHEKSVLPVPLELPDGRPQTGLACLWRFLDSIHEGLIVIDARGCVAYVNEPVRAMHDRPGAMVGFHIRDIEGRFSLSNLRGEPIAFDQWPLCRLVRGEAVPESAVWIRNHHTGRRWVAELAGEPIRDDAGEPFAHVLTVRDVTDRHRADQRMHQLAESLEQRVAERTAEVERRVEQLQALTQQLSEAEDRERRRLAELLHDDLQQILVAAKFHLSLLSCQLGGQQAEQARRVDDMLGESIQKSRSLAHDLNPPALRRGGLVGGLQWLAGRVEQKHGLHVELVAPEPVEPQTDAMRVFLFKAVQELLLNTVKHARVLRARVRVARRREWVVVSVADAGPGFDPAGLRGAGGSAGGFGLLSIQERVDLLGGRMRIRSAPGHGSRFTLSLPARQGPAGPPRVGPPSQRVRVLLVDDHRVVREGLASFLNDEDDLEVVAQAGGGAEALDLVRRFHPDVVLMDITMPGMTGIEATQHIRARWPEVRVIGLSMHDEADLAGEMLRAGAGSYLTKGCPGEDLLAAIRQARRAPL